MPAVIQSLRPQLRALATGAASFRAAVLAAGVSAVLACVPAMAATSFSTDFGGPALDANLTQTYTAAGTTLTVGGTAAFTGGADGQYRSFVGTVDSDYGVSPNNWTATIEVSTAGPLAGNQLFFGLGRGISAGRGADPWGEPMESTQPAAYMAIYPQSATRSMAHSRKQANQGYWTGYVDISDAAFDTAAGTTGGVADNAFYRYSMAYDAVAQTLTFDVEKISGFGGTVTSSGAGNIRVVSLAGMGYDGTNGRIFFGGYGSTFDNLSVIVVSPANTDTTTTVATSADPVTAGAPVTFTATVAPASGTTVPTGAVQFKVDGVDVGSPVTVTTGTSPNGTAALVTSALTAAGPHTITANYTATGSFNNSSGSTSQTVDPAAATALAFTTAPGNAYVGSAFGTQPVVVTRDAYGNNSTVGLAASKTVTIAIKTGTGTLSGTPTYDIGTGAGNGTITGSGLAIDTAGGFTLSANAPGLTEGVSTSFIVANTSFTTGFDGPSLDANLTPTYAASGTTLTTSGTAAFTGGADGQYRSFVGTVGSDYGVSTNNWTATIEVYNGSPRSDTSNQGFFGLGTGTTTGPGAPIYGEPMGNTGNQPAAYMSMYGQASGLGRSMGTERKQSNQAYFASEVNLSDAEFDTAVGTTGGVADNAYYRYTMAYDYMTQTLTFDVDQISGFGGTVTSSGAGNIRVVSLAGMGYDGTNGRIFFGGYNSTFDNLSVKVGPGTEASTTTLAANSNTTPSTYGDLLSFDVTVSGGAGTPSGFVFLKDGGPDGTTIGSSNLIGGACTITTTTLAPGTHDNIVAVYYGDPTYLTSTSAVLSPAQVVVKASSTVAVTGPTSFTYNGSPQGPATVSKTGSSGAVTYEYVGTGGTTYPASGTPPTDIGTYSCTATLAEDANYFGAVSAAYAFAIVAPVLPPNDDFANAIALPGTSGTQTGTDNLNATLETGEPAINAATHTVWFKWTAPSNGSYTISTAGSTRAGGGEWDAMLGIYTGSAVDALTALPGTPQDNDGAETMTVTATAGTTYHIQAAGYEDQEATNIKLTCTFVGTGTSYATWETANGASGGANADSNHNGVPNGVEFFMGGTAASPATLPALVDTAGTWTWTLPYDPAALATYKFQISDELSGWTDVLPGAPSIAVLTGPDRLRLTLPAGTGKKFCRLVVTTP